MHALCAGRSAAQAARMGLVAAIRRESLTRRAYFQLSTRLRHTNQMGEKILHAEPARREACEEACYT